MVPWYWIPIGWFAIFGLFCTCVMVGAFIRLSVDRYRKNKQAKASEVKKPYLQVYSGIEDGPRGGK